MEARAQFRTALQAIDAAAADNLERSQAIRERVRWLQEGIDAGETLRQLIELEERPLVVEMLTANMTVLETVGAQLRAAQALALREEGMTISAIAEAFGVTRQRISALLRQKAATEI